MFLGGMPFVVFGTDSFVFYTFSAIEVFVRPADVVFGVVLESRAELLPRCKGIIVLVNTLCI